MTGLDRFFLLAGGFLLAAFPFLLTRATRRGDKRRVFDIVSSLLFLATMGISSWEPAPPAWAHGPIARWTLLAVLIVGGANLFGLSYLLFKPRKRSERPATERP